MKVTYGSEEYWKSVAEINADERRFFVVQGWRVSEALAAITAAGFGPLLDDRERREAARIAAEYECTVRCF